MKKEKKISGRDGREPTIPVRVSCSLYGAAQKTARAEHRTIAGQVEYWARLGRATLDNPDLPVELVRSILAAQRRQEIEPFVPEE
ncbi:MAG: hypothetical protein GX181_03165 [Synergistaceae bacterium]|nr:hypothetical protein [Synergistota bacterium]NLM70947.1 hypothetical protein [Synergistaceae bacterium]